MSAWSATGTPLARLRHKDKWERQAEVLRQSLSVHQSAGALAVAPSTAFRWRHRFLQLARDVRARVLQGVVEADETYFERSTKGQSVRSRQARRRGGSAAKPGLSDEQEPVLAPDAVLCTDGGGAQGAAARHLGVEHHALNIPKGPRVQGAWHIQNANAYHGRLKNWMRRFKGVASSYLASYLGWFPELWTSQLKRLASPRRSWL